MQELAGNSGALQAQDLDLPIFCISCEIFRSFFLKCKQSRAALFLKLPAWVCSGIIETKCIEQAAFELSLMSSVHFASCEQEKECFCWP